MPLFKNTRNGYLMLMLFMALLIMFILDLIIGPVKIPVKSMFQLLFNLHSDNMVWETIFFDFRTPKAITAILAGSALSVSGLMMQTVFRNPLAGPDVLGISAGASLGVAFVILGFGHFFTGLEVSYLSNWLQIIAAWIGSAAVLLIVLAVSVRVRDIMTILILGILFGSATMALVSILQYFSHQTMLKAFMVWSMGSLGNLTHAQLNVLIISILAGFIILLFVLKSLNVLLLGETYAHSMGLNIKRARVFIFLATSILAGSITAFCGPIGFIGIAVPHIARLIFKTADHKLLVPACLLLGSILMLLSDLVSQIPGTEAVLPVNSVTALLGIPVVIWVIIKNQRLVNIN